MKNRKSKLFLIVAMLVMSIFAAITCIAGCKDGNEPDTSVYVIRGAKDIPITTEVTAYDFLDGVTGTKDGEEYEVTCDSSAVVFGTVGSYDVVYTCGTETKTVKCIISAPVVVYALELTKTSDSFTVFETAESTDFDAKSYISVATADGTDVKNDVTVSGSVTWGTVGDYEITYSLGGLSKKLTVSVTMPECVLTLSETQVSFKSVYDGADFDATSYISVATADGDDAKAHVTILGTDDIKFGTPGSYQLVYSLGDKTATLTVTVNAPAYTVSASDFNIKNTVAEADVTDAAIIGYANASGTLDEEAHAVTVDWSAIQFGTNGDYDVVFTCGTAEKTVKCHVVDRVYELVLTKSEETFAASATAESTEFDKSSYVQTAKCEGADATADVNISGDITWGTPGDYEITYTLGNLTRVLTVTISEPVYVLELKVSALMFASKTTEQDFDEAEYIKTATRDGADAKSSVVVSGTVTWGTPGDYTLTYTLGDTEKTGKALTITVTVSEPVYVLELTKDSDSFKSIADSEGFDAKSYISVATIDDDDAKAEVEVTGTVTWGVSGQYTLAFKLGGLAPKTVTITIQNPVFAISGTKDLTVKSGDSEDFDFLDGVSGTQDGEKACEVKVNAEAVVWTAAGEYDVVYTCGIGNFAETVTVKCKVYTAPALNLKAGVTSVDLLVTDVESFDASEFVEAKDCFDEAITEFDFNEELLVIESGDTNTVNLEINVTDAAGNTANVTLPVTLYTAAAWYGREITGEKMSFFIKVLDTTGLNSVSWDETEGAYHLDNKITEEDDNRIFALDFDYIKGVQQNTGAISVALWVKPDKENCKFHADFINDGGWNWQNSYYYLQGSQNAQEYHQIIFNFADFLADEKAPMLLTDGAGMYVKGIEFVVPKASGETAASMFIAKDDWLCNGIVYDSANSKFVFTNNSNREQAGDERFFIINPDYISAMKEKGYTYISFDVEYEGEFYIAKYKNNGAGWFDMRYDSHLIDISGYSEGETIGFLKAARGTFAISNLQFSKAQYITADDFVVSDGGLWSLTTEDEASVVKLQHTKDANTAAWWQDQTHQIDLKTAIDFSDKNISGIIIEYKNDYRASASADPSGTTVVFGCSNYLQYNDAAVSASAGWNEAYFGSDKATLCFLIDGQFKDIKVASDGVDGSTESISIKKITILYN